METKNENYGLIYVLTNPCMPNIVKIGQTTKKDLAQRMKDLFSTGVPAPFVAAASCRVPLDQLDKVESALHKAFEKQRVYKTREFFSVSPESVRPILEALESVQGYSDAVSEVNVEIENATKADDTKYRRENMDFLKMKLHIGDTLIYIKDASITCTIVSNKKVDYKDEHGVSLSYVSKLLLGRGVQPALYWKTKDGVKLIDLYNKQVVDETTEQFAATDAAIAAANAEYDKFKTECQ